MSACFDAPLVSVIVPIYNVESFISETIQSILDQSIKSLEVVLVDDGSTDKSADICSSFLVKDARIKLFKQENSGVSIARNNGLKAAKGQFVFFMDADDTLDTNFLKTSLEVAQRGNNDIVVIGEHYITRMPTVYALPTCAQLWKRSFLERHPEIRFPEHIQPCEDGLFSHQLLALQPSLSANPAGVYHYRTHPNQNHTKINSNVESVLRQIPEWFSLLESFYERNGLFKTQALRLGLFIEHEPFDLRYNRMPLNNIQKSFLHSLIKDFMKKNVLPYLKETDKRLFSKNFLNFLTAKEYTEYDVLYKKYLSSKARQKKTYMLLTKLVFINSLKQRLRQNIRRKFSE